MWRRESATQGGRSKRYTGRLSNANAARARQAKAERGIFARQASARVSAARHEAKIETDNAAAVKAQEAQEAEVRLMWQKAPRMVVREAAVLSFLASTSGGSSKAEAYALAYRATLLSVPTVRRWVKLFQEDGPVVFDDAWEPEHDWGVLHVPEVRHDLQAWVRDNAFVKGTGAMTSESFTAHLNVVLGAEVKRRGSLFSVRTGRRYLHLLVSEQRSHVGRALCSLCVCRRSLTVAACAYTSQMIVKPLLTGKLDQLTAFAHAFMSNIRVKVTREHRRRADRYIKCYHDGMNGTAAFKFVKELRSELAKERRAAAAASGAGVGAGAGAPASATPSHHVHRADHVRKARCPTCHSSVARSRLSARAVDRATKSHPSPPQTPAEG